MSQTFDRYWPPLGWAAFTAVVWILTIADPCLTSGLPIGITECSRHPDGGVALTRLDVLIRLAGLSFLMGTFGFVFTLFDSQRRKLEMGLLACGGVTAALAVHMTLGSVWAPPRDLLALYFSFWLASSIVAGLAAILGTSIAGAVSDV